MQKNSFKRLFAFGLLLTATVTQAQVKGPIERFAATTVNVNGAGEPITIELLKWSTDAERDRLASVLAWYGEKEVPAAMPTVTASAIGKTRCRSVARISRSGGASAIVSPPRLDARASAC